MQIQTLDDVRHIAPVSLTPVAPGTELPEKGTVVGPDGKPIIPDDINCILDSRKNPETGEYFRLQSWGQEKSIDNTVQEKNYSPEIPENKSNLQRKATIGGAALTAILALFGCGKDQSPIGPILPQNYTIRAHHCMEGEKSTLIKSAVPGEYLSVSISELGIDGVDPDWIAAFEPNAKNFITMGRNGSVSIQTDQGHSEYAVMVYPQLIKNEGTGLTPEYGWIYDDSPGLWNNKTRHSIYRRDLDNVTEDFDLKIPDDDWQYVINHFKDVLGINSRGALNINWSDDHLQDDFSYGYAICYWQGKRVDGLHGGSEGVVVDPERMRTSKQRRGVALEEMFEQLTGTQNFGNRNPSSMYIQSQGKPNDNLTYLLHFVYSIKAGGTESTGGISVRIGFK